MPDPLLETKLFAARVRTGAVPRARLTSRLTQGSTGKLLLISAPAGFGKTTALAQWTQTFRADTRAPEEAGGSPGVAWVSLDPSDSDPVTFWSYVLSALHKAVPELGEAQLQQLRDPTAPAAATTLLLTGLLNDIADLPHDVMLVLDDYHVIDAGDVHEAVTFLLDHAPPQLHVAVASRIDPPLPLARFRARGELTELRAADLRFTAGEAASYLNGVMGLGLTGSEVSALEGRTEGWIAALQLAALSIQGRDDVAGFIGGFAGDDRYIVDYLVEEVLQRQPAHIEQFLLRTAVLEQLTGSLCDALTDQADGQSTLEALERANLFVVPLDDQRRWYRYHHLFADVLRARLLSEHRPLAVRLHQRASDWYAHHGQRDPAIRHALAGHDPHRAADLLERAVPDFRRDRSDRSLREWLEQLPTEVIAARPVLSVGFAGSLLSTGTTDGVARHLDDAARWLAGANRPGASGMVVVDPEGFRRLPGWVAVYRAGLAQARGDTPGTIAHARTALDQLTVDDSTGRAAASALLGLASWRDGDLDAAHAAYTTSQMAFLQNGFFTDVLGCAVVLADIRKTQGRLQDALDTHVTALDSTACQVPTTTSTVTAAGAAAPPLRGVIDAYVGMADVYRERDDLAEATRLLDLAHGLDEHAGLPRARYRWHVVMARVRQAEGNLTAAASLLDKAERAYVDDFHPDVQPVAATRARVWVAQRRLDEVLAWANARGLTLSDEVTYLHEHEHLTLARAQLASPGGRDDVVRFLDRLLASAESGCRIGTVIEVLTLRAVARSLSVVDREAGAGSLADLERALTLAEPEGYVRTFLDEGQPVVSLLRRARAAGMCTQYVQRLLQSHTDRHADEAADVSIAVAAGAMREQVDDGLVVEPLSQREHDVLRLLATELNGPNIARELVLSLNTVRTHTKNIYAKLGVNNRRAAVRRAHQLNLLRSQRTH